MGEWKVKKAAPVLKDILFGAKRYNNEKVRDRALDALRKVKPEDFTEFIPYLDHDDDQVRSSARGIIRSYKERALPFWLQRIKTVKKNKLELIGCILAIGYTGENSPQAIELLVEYMSDPKQHPDVRREATWELAEMVTAVDPLLNTLGSRDERTIRYAMEAFERMVKSNNLDISPSRPKIMKNLVPFLQNESKDLRVAAAMAIGYIADIEDLKEIALKHFDEDVREFAQYILEERQLLLQK